jgi:drug/metabolite transporter (DMT)-like permease
MTIRSLVAPPGHRAAVGRNAGQAVHPRHLAAVLPVLGALGYALTMIAARPLGRTETAAAMAFWGNFGFLVCALILSAIFGHGRWAATAPEALRFLMLPWIWPQPLDFLAMAVCGAIAAAALTLLTQAYRVAPAALVAPFEYSFMFWALLWGWLFWGDLPDPLAWLGIAVIIGAGLHLLRAEARATAG